MSTYDFCNARKPGKGKASILCTLDAGHEGDHKEGARSWPQTKPMRSPGTADARVLAEIAAVSDSDIDAWFAEHAEPSVAEQIAAELDEREQMIVDVRDIYGDEAAQLVVDGWTVDSAIAHVQGDCDRVLCTGTHDDDIELARAATLAVFAQPAERVIAHDRDERDACQRGTLGCCIDHDADRIDSCESW